MRKTALIIFCVILILTGCPKKDPGKDNKLLDGSKAQIPVREKVVALEKFISELSYSAPLGGSEESSAQAMVADVVTAVMAKVGDRVSAGQLILTFPKTTPTAQFEQASTAVSATKKAYDRIKNLQQQGAVAQQELDNIEAQYKVAQANLNAAEQIINVRSPISGVITNIAVNQGDRSYPGQILFTVAKTDGYKAKLMVSDKDVQQLKVGTPAVAIWNSQEINGKVSRVALALDPYQKAVPVEVTFPRTVKGISLGSTVQIRLQIFTKEDAIVVNRENLLKVNDQYYVWVDKNNQAVKKPVIIGMDNQLQFEIILGLEPGDKLITEGMTLLYDRAPLKVIE
jgi:membrane fusion protein, multidrug efflux system